MDHYSADGWNQCDCTQRMTIPEYKTTTIEKQTFILSHYGVGKSCWDWLILIVSFYVAIVVPYNATFKEKRRPVTLEDQSDRECEINSIDIFVEIVFLIGEWRPI